MSQSAARLTNQLFQEDWASTPPTPEQTEAKISYLMVEQIAPPKDLWEKISRKLDQQDGIVAAAPVQLPEVSSNKTIVLMVASAAAIVALMLYWLV